jgi:hypothetical protein
MPHTCPVLADAGARERPFLSLLLFVVIPTGAKRSGGTCSAPLLLYPLFGCHPEDPEGDEGSAVVLFKYPWQPSVRTKPEPALTKSIGAGCPVPARSWPMRERESVRFCLWFYLLSSRPERSAAEGPAARSSSCTRFSAVILRTPKGTMDLRLFCSNTHGSHRCAPNPGRH